MVRVMSCYDEGRDFPSELQDGWIMTNEVPLISSKTITGCSVCH